MKIFVDDGLSLNKKKTGIGYFSHDLIEIYKKLGHDVSIWKYPRFLKSLPGIVQRFIYLLLFNKLAFSKAYDFIVYTNFVMPPFKHKAKVIVVIHDLAVFKFPETFPIIYRYYFQWGISNTIKYSNYFFTVSNTIKREIMDKYQIKEPKIFTIYSMIRSHFSYPKIYIDRAKQFLFVGVIEKRKNITLLCDAFKQFANQYSDYQLVLIGKPGFGFKQIIYYFENTPNIIYLNYVSTERLVEEYAKSCAFVFPSLYEGFGLPVIEAMKYNLPIIASDIPTNRELNNRHNGNFFFFDPNDVNSMVNAFICSVNNYRLPMSIDLSFYNIENLALLHKSVLEKII
jgi:glycosyltransferase involved in cell wall biosynthesis